VTPAATLIEVDNRSVNLQRQDLNDMEWGLQRLVSLRRSNQGRAPNRFEFSAFDTWVQKDEILIRDGVLILNLLNGAHPRMAPADNPGIKSIGARWCTRMA
jgi:hypothetical protein